MRNGPSFHAAILFCIVPLLGGVLAADEPTNKFRVSGGGTITGTEEYRIQQTAEGYRLSSTAHLEQAHELMEIRQEQTLAADWSLMRCQWELEIAGDRQTFESWRNGQQIELRLRAGAESQSQFVEFRPSTLVLDTLTAGDYQILLDSMANKTAGHEHLWVLTPQQLDSVPAKLDATGGGQGTLEGEPIHLRRYNLEVGGTLVEIWAEARGRKLMQIFIPAQEVELVREGFALTWKRIP